MKLIVTGGAGFLGYNLCQGFSSHWDEIQVLDIRPIARSEYPSNVTFAEADVRDGEKLKALFRGANAVVHAAAAMPIEGDRLNHEVNVRGTRNVLQAAAENSIDRVAHISTTYVYGVPATNPVSEEGPLRGLDIYGKTKIEAESVCAEFRSKGMCVPVARAKTFIGASRLGVFAILYDWVKSGKRIPLIGKGGNHYQLLEVEDLVNAIHLLLSRPREDVNDVFNVAAEKFQTAYEDVEALCTYAGAGARPLRTPAGIIKTILSVLEMLKVSPLYKTLYETADKDCYVSVRKIRQKLGWYPKYSNVDALIRSYQWYVDTESTHATGRSNSTAWQQGVLGLIKKVL
jgi:nucleoside-diphosphate-sugar epimerase